MRKILNILFGVVIDIFALIPETITSIQIEWRIFIGVIGVVVIISPYIYQPIKILLNRSLLSLKKVKIGIAINNASDLDIIKFCNEEIQQLGLSSRIKFVEYRLAHKDSDKIRKSIKLSKKLDLVVWSEGKETLHHKIPLFFTYKDTTDRYISKIVHNSLHSVVSRDKLFNLNRETFDLDVSIEKANIADFALFIVAICSQLFRGIDSGIFVFEKLYGKIKTKNNTLSSIVRERLKDLYSIKGRNFIYKEKYLAGIEILEKGYTLNKKDPEILAALALAKFMTKDEVSAEIICKDLLQNHTGFPIAHLDGAFFRLKNKKYKRALVQYSCYKKLRPDPAITLEAITFLSHRLDKNPEEIGYLFGRAFLKRLISTRPELIGESTYIQDLQSFCNRAIGKEEYLPLFEYAQKIIT